MERTSCLSSSKRGVDQRRGMLMLCCLVLILQGQCFLHYPNIRCSNTRAYRGALIGEYHFQRSSRLHAEKPDDNDEKLDQMMKFIAANVKEGREDELTKAGLKVTKMSPRETLDDKLQNSQIKQTVLGSMTSEDEEVMNLINEAMDELENNSNGSSSSSGMDLDPAVFAELQAEAWETLQTLRNENQHGSSLASILENDPEAEGFGAPRQVDRDEYDDVKNVMDNIMRPSVSSSSSSNSWNPQMGVDRTLDFGSSSTSSSSFGPPVAAPGSVLEVEEEADEDEDTDVALDNSSNDSDASGISSSSSSGEEVSAQDTFAQLLKASMDQQLMAGDDSDGMGLPDDVDGDVVRNTVDAFTQGDLANVDMNSLLGDVMSTLTEQMGIDMKAELQSSPGVMNDMKKLMAANMAELSKNMADLDNESQVLYDQLSTLEADLRRETADFDEKKQLELGDLLESQNALQSEFSKSRAKVEITVAQLENMMKDLEDNADFLTSLALFSVKRVDKKIAFVLGLALVFKVPFDASQLIALRSLDFSDWLTVGTQGLLSLACLNHYGILPALFRKSKPFGMPPPPQETTETNS